MKKLLLIAILALSCMKGWANPIGIETARKNSAAMLLARAQSGMMTDSPKQELYLEKQSSTESVGYPLYYIFNRTNGGFVIAAGDDFISEVLAYSETGNIDSNNMPESMEWWLKQYEKMAIHAIKNGIKLKEGDESNKETIKPLLTCTWDQGYPFNSMCPRDANGERCVTGCVATAMAQVMYYHRWPETGLGTNKYSFFINNDPSTPMTLSADFGNTTYHWNDMRDSYKEGNIPDKAYNAVATLMLHCGIALEMNEARALKRFFKYNYDIVNLQHVSDEDFAEIVYNELAEKRPVLVGGKDKMGGDGHLFVCDGYQNGFFHINWGWSGAGDTYCHPDALIPQIGKYDYSEDHRLIYNIRPYIGEIPDGVVELQTSQAGSLEGDMPEMTPYATALKLSGPLNGTDMLTLRKMCGRDENEVETDGMLVDLDLEYATFVAGGDVYCENYTVTDPNAFPNHGMYYTNLERVVLPNSVTRIDKCAFEMCQELRDVVLNENLERIEQEAFYHCSNLPSITLPQNITSIGPWAFDGDDKLIEIQSYATTPPTAYETTFSSSCYDKATLYVPKGTKSAYQEKAPWNSFKNIVEMEGIVEKVAQAIWTKGNTTLTFIYDEKVYKEGDLFNGQIVTNVWNDKCEDYEDGSIYKTYWNCEYYKWNDDVRTSLTRAEFDKSFADFTLADTRGWFSECVELRTIKGLQYLKTDQVRMMDDMFLDCCNLTSLDVSHFNTGNVRSMLRMFQNCSRLTALNLSSFNTSNVTNMSWMFDSCSSLTSLDVSNFNTSNVLNISGMFRSCSSLSSLDVKHFNTSKVMYMNMMFHGCSKLTSLDVNNFDTSNLTSMYAMFGECSSLTSLNLNNFDTRNVECMSAMFSSCSNLVSLNLSNFDTSNVTDMSHMFTGCSKLASLDLSSFNTSNVTDMQGMFALCNAQALTTMDWSHFDTSKVTTMYRMFAGIDGPAHLDLSHFNTANVTDMDQMFWDSSGLVSLDLSSFDTSNVTNMSAMFEGCSSIISLDLSSFDTRNVKSMTAMFFGCSSLRTLSLGKGFNTDFVTDDAFYKPFLDVRNVVVYVDGESKPFVDTALNLVKFNSYNGHTTSTESLLATSEDGINYWTTYYNSVASMTVPEGVDAYTGTIEDNQIILKKIENGIIPKGNAVILRGSADKIILNVNTTPKSIFESNELSGVDVKSSTPFNSYILGDEDGIAGFCLYNGETLPAHSAFLQREDANVLFYPLYSDDIVNSILQTQQAGKIIQGNIFNLQGQRINSLRKGLNIVKRQKLFVQ